MGLKVLAAFGARSVGIAATHHVDSYNAFLNRVDEVIERATELPEDGVRVTNLRRMSARVANENQQLTPVAAIARRETYGVEMYADIEVNGIVKTKQVLIGRMPIMIGSAWDDVPADEGVQIGTFIVGGNEIVIVSQERAATNRVTVTETPSEGRYSYSAEIRSNAMDGCRRSSLMLRLRRNGGAVDAMLPGFKKPVPVGIVVIAICPDAWRQADAARFTAR